MKCRGLKIDLLITIKSFTNALSRAYIVYTQTRKRRRIMTRYTKEQLAAMAAIALEDKAKGGMKYMQLTLQIMLHTGLPIEEIDRRIEQLAVQA